MEHFFKLIWNLTPSFLTKSPVDATFAQRLVNPAKFLFVHSATKFIVVSQVDSGRIIIHIEHFLSATVESGVMCVEVVSMSKIIQQCDKVFVVNLAKRLRETKMLKTTRFVVFCIKPEVARVSLAMKNNSILGGDNWFKL